MKNVHILSEQIISKIAAGEVIERPASVVKELLENALDAQADSIEIHLEEAGKRQIQIKDNGNGIEKDDLPQIFLRHATSKIHSADDLFNLHTLGFRGEALYSIAAVSDVTIESKTKEADSGWKIHTRASVSDPAEPCAFNAHGTHILINELFFNTPARKKFLKSDTTEMNQILGIVTPFTLLYPNVRFLLTHKNRRILDLSPAMDVKERASEVLKLNSDHLIYTEHTFEDQRCDVKILVGDMNITRNRRDLQYIFVNDRPVQNKAISYHMNSVFRLIMPNTAFPFFCVYLNIPPESVDVNIHPTKREVKIDGEQSLCHVLRAMTEDVIMKSGKIKQATNQANVKSEHDTSRNSYELPAVDKTNFIAQSLKRAFTQSDQLDSHSTEGANEVEHDPYTFPRPEGADLFQMDLSSHVANNQKNDLHKVLGEARFIGPLRQKFLLFESELSLLIVDQHAAQERIIYEQFMRQMDKSSMEVQHLLSPVTISLNAVEMMMWEDHQDELSQMGFETTLFDDQTIAVHSHPQLIKDTEKAVRLMLSGEKIAHCDFATLARRACRASIMAGDKMSASQAEFQREQLLNCSDPFTCPHGRPIVVEMTESFLDKQFLRT